MCHFITMLPSSTAATLWAVDYLHKQASGAVSAESRIDQTAGTGKTAVRRMCVGFPSVNDWRSVVGTKTTAKGRASDKLCSAGSLKF
jgi:hypothetical protein